jgi:hypothetical protein
LIGGDQWNEVQSSNTERVTSVQNSTRSEAQGIDIDMLEGAGTSSLIHFHRTSSGGTSVLASSAARPHSYISPLTTKSVIHDPCFDRIFALHRVSSLKTKVCEGWLAEDIFWRRMTTGWYRSKVFLEQMALHMTFDLHETFPTFSERKKILRLTPLVVWASGATRCHIYPPKSRRVVKVCEAQPTFLSQPAVSPDMSTTGK